MRICIYVYTQDSANELSDKYRRMNDCARVRVEPTIFSAVCYAIRDPVTVAIIAHHSDAIRTPEICMQRAEFGEPSIRACNVADPFLPHVTRWPCRQYNFVRYWLNE